MSFVYLLMVSNPPIITIESPLIINGQSVVIIDQWLLLGGSIHYQICSMALSGAATASTSSKARWSSIWHQGMWRKSWKMCFKSCFGSCFTYFHIMFNQSFHHHSWLFDDVWWLVGVGCWICRHLDLPHSLFKWCFLSASKLRLARLLSLERNEELRGRPAPSPWHFKGALRTIQGPCTCCWNLLNLHVEDSAYLC